MKQLTVYSVIITYDDYTQDLDNIYPSEESAVKSARRLLSQPDIIEVQVNKDSVTEQFGRSWKKTVYRETKQALG